MGQLSFTMSAKDTPSWYALACRDLLNAAAAADEVLVWPTVLVTESEDRPGGARRLTVSARTAPRSVQ